jgi:hypothetical protein
MPYLSDVKKKEKKTPKNDHTVLLKIHTSLSVLFDLRKSVTFFLDSLKGSWGMQLTVFELSLNRFQIMTVWRLKKKTHLKKVGEGEGTWILKK